MKAIIVDDEKLAVENLISILSLFEEEIEIIDTSHSAAEAIEKIDQQDPDLVFLDIEMPNGDGFEVLKGTKTRSYEVIFITAYSQYAVKALRMSALDYITKPIDPDDLSAALGRAKESIKKKRKSNYEPLLQSYKTGLFEKLGISTSEGILYVNIDLIIRFQASSNYTEVHLDDKKNILVSKTLKSFEQLLHEADFIRVHQSHLVNKKYIQSLQQKDGAHLLLTNGESIPVSRSKRAEVSSLLKSI